MRGQKVRGQERREGTVGGEEAGVGEGAGLHNQTSTSLCSGGLKNSKKDLH